MGAQHQWKLWEEPLDPCLCYKGSKTRRGEAPGRCCTFYLLSDLLPCNSFKNYISISNCWARRRVNRKPKRFCELWVLFHVARSGGGGDDVLWEYALETGSVNCRLEAQQHNFKQKETPLQCDGRRIRDSHIIAKLQWAQTLIPPYLVLPAKLPGCVASVVTQHDLPAAVSHSLALCSARALWLPCITEFFWLFPPTPAPPHEGHWTAEVLLTLAGFSKWDVLCVTHSFFP